MITDRDAERLLIFCDEDAETQDPVAALSALHAGKARPLALLIGPEGGFAEDERSTLFETPERCAACARAAHPARRYRGGGGAHAGSIRARRLALGLCSHRLDRRLQN